MDAVTTATPHLPLSHRRLLQGRRRKETATQRRAFRPLPPCNLSPTPSIDNASNAVANKGELLQGGLLVP